MQTCVTRTRKTDHEAEEEDRRRGQTGPAQSAAWPESFLLVDRRRLKKEIGVQRLDLDEEELSEQICPEKESSRTV